MKFTGAERLEKKIENRLGAPGFAWVGSSAILNGEQFKGVKILREHGAASPHDILGRLALGRAELLDGNYSEALELFQEAIEIDRCSPGAWRGFLDASKFLGEDEQANRAREMLLFLDPFYFSTASPVVAPEFEEELEATTPPSDAAPAQEGSEVDENIGEGLSDFVLDGIFGDMSAIGDVDIPVTQVAAILDRQEELQKTEEAVQPDTEVASEEAGEEETYVAPVTGSDVSSAIDALFGDDSDSFEPEAFEIAPEETTMPMISDVGTELGKLLEDDSFTDTDQAETDEAMAQAGETVHAVEISDEGKELLSDLDSLLVEQAGGADDTSPEGSGEQEISGLDSVFELDESPEIQAANLDEALATAAPVEKETSQRSDDPLANAVVDELDSLFGKEEESEVQKDEDLLLGSQTEPSTSGLDIVSGSVGAVSPASAKPDPVKPFDSLFETDFSLEEGVEEKKPVDVEKPSSRESGQNSMDELLSDLDEISDFDLSDSSLFGPSSEPEGLSDPSRPTLSSTETMAEIYASQGHYEEALNILNELVDKDPENSAIIEKIEEIKRRQSEEGKGDEA